ncbi:MAG: cellulase family glycosylhydrolase [Erysipelotrichales bacterium]|nr:cellulase family glycosylhydrolase [Erysipelotrichales bacterium]MBQ4375857.1 cellulase family glycosylhydrolase [Erysipelotrichales bacterium]
MRQFPGYTRGINFGGWFSQCDHTEKRYDYFIRKEDFRRVKRWGLDHVRIPVDYELLQDKDGNFLEKGMKRLENCVNWCEEYGLNMILDLHKTWGFSFDDGENEEGFFENPVYQENFYKVWEEFAKRFGNRKNLAFELLNEVTDREYKDIWNAIVRKAISRIRVYAPRIPVLVGGYYHNSVTAVKDLDLPYDENVVYNFHCYSPLIFTHQGAYWIPKMDTGFRMAFDSKNKQYREYTDQYIGKEFKDEFGNDDEKIDSRYFEELFAEAIKVAEERNVPLYCGEYGVIDLASPEDTVKWFESIHTVFENHHIGRACWSYKEMDFGLVDAHYDDVRKNLIKLL